MNSLKRWLKLEVWPWIAVRFFRLEEVEKFIASTDERYLDAATWARIRGISKAEAYLELEEGIRLKYFEKCLLYEWSDSPVPFVIPKSYLGRSVRLADVGYVGEDDQREVLISPGRVREVFIAAEKGTSKLALKGPTNIKNLAVISDKALDLTGDLAEIGLTKFRFKIGCGLIGIAILLFLAGHLLRMTKYFTPEFPAHSWQLTITLLVFGVAFAGKKVVSGLASAVKSVASLLKSIS